MSGLDHLWYDVDTSVCSTPAALPAMELVLVGEFVMASVLCPCTVLYVVQVKCTHDVSLYLAHTLVPHLL